MRPSPNRVRAVAVVAALALVLPADPASAAPRRSYLVTTEGLGVAPAALAVSDGLTAGDFDGDGIDQLVTPGPLRANPTKPAHAGVLVLAQDPRGPSRSTALRINSADNRTDTAGNPVSRAFGYSSAAVDVNGDGFDDLVVGDPAYSPVLDGVTATQTGEVQVIPGSARGLRPSQRVRLNVEAGLPADLNGNFGTTITGGDFNLDGFGDVVVSAPNDAVLVGDVLVRTGSVTVFPGSATGLDVARHSTFTLATLGIQDEPTGAGEAFGTHLAVGDYDGDGWPDLAVSFWALINNSFRQGRVQILYGGGGGLAVLSTQVVATPRRGSDSGTPPIDDLAAGDLNGDNIDDVVIGDGGGGVLFDGGRVVVVPGSFEGIVQSGTLVVTQGGEVGDEIEPDDAFGATVAVADLNGDGFDDVVASAPSERNGRHSGLLHVLRGSGTGLTGTGGWTLDERSRPVAGRRGGMLGAAMVLGRFDNDAQPDLVASAPTAPAGGHLLVLMALERFGP